ncbi:hypothetical protein HYALB_00012412 [Hymenoscyphus albidus]|uniref:Uncharacterized protein n=1 Tax=Hymenoscyphus albidus TaxID=595503 RepID=A0A9N9Q8F3_9HELO|nr:hypothetical protein HYALB_00012412 [Hymenoscyphus albidus]
MSGPLPTGTCATCKKEEVKLRPNPFNQKLQCSECRDSTIIGITELQKRYGLKHTDLEGLTMTTEPQPAFRGGPDRKWYSIKDVEKRVKVVEKERAKEKKEKEKKAAEKQKAKEEKEEEKKRAREEKEEKKRFKAEEKEAAAKQKAKPKKEVKRKHEGDEDEEVPASPKKRGRPSKTGQTPTKSATTPKKGQDTDSEPTSDIEIVSPQKRKRPSKASVASEGGSAAASANMGKQRKSVAKGAEGPASPIRKLSRPSKATDSLGVNEPRKSITVGGVVKNLDRRASLNPLPSD